MLGDPRTFWLVVGVLALLGVATAVGRFLRRQTEGGLDPAIVDQFNRRILAWWFICAALATAFLLGRTATVILFGLASFWALREFITLTPTRIADHRALFWVFFVFTPLQYLLVDLEREGLFSILIPVYAFLFIPARVALAGDFKRFLERTAKIQAGLMICVYCLSYAPAILMLDREEIARSNPASQQVEVSDAASNENPLAPRPEPEVVDTPLTPAEQRGQNARLLFFFILVVHFGDVLQLACEKLFGKHVIAPGISQNKTWEGFLGGIGSSTLLGMALWWATPFANPLIPAGLALVTAVMGFAGGLTMSAIKRDRGVKDYGTLVEGHGGVLDRIDSLCFAAPVFYQVCKYIFYLGG